MNDTNKFLNLPIEIITLILQEVEAVDRDSLRSVCRTLPCSLTPGDQLHLNGYFTSPTWRSYSLNRSEFNFLDHFLKALLMNPTIADKVVYVIAVIVDSRLIKSQISKHESQSR